jgi:hypothetical protein
MGSPAATGATRAGVRVATLQTSGAGGQPQSGELRSSVPSSRRRPISGLARHWGSSDATASASAGRRTGAARGPACLPPPRKSQFEVLRAREWPSRSNGRSSRGRRSGIDKIVSA